MYGCLKSSQCNSWLINSQNQNVLIGIFRYLWLLIVLPGSFELAKRDNLLLVLTRCDSELGQLGEIGPCAKQLIERSYVDLG